MSSPSDEFTYGKDFAVRLRGEKEPVTVRVNTRLRVVMDLTSSEIQEHKGRVPCVPQYIFGHGGELPRRASIQALGRHYFTW